jgi:hypothetical protein
VTTRRVTVSARQLPPFADVFAGEPVSRQGDGTATDEFATR